MNTNTPAQINNRLYRSTQRFNNHLNFTEYLSVRRFLSLKAFLRPPDILLTRSVNTESVLNQYNICTPFLTNTVNPCRPWLRIPQWHLTSANAFLTLNYIDSLSRKRPETNNRADSVLLLRPSPFYCVFHFCTDISAATAASVSGSICHIDGANLTTQFWAEQ